MSLGDHLRYLRAMADVQPAAIAEALGLETAGVINLAEVRYRPVEDEGLVAALAAYFGRPVAEFEWHNARARKYLTFYVQRGIVQQETITLTLRSGEVMSGQPEWWDLASIGLRTEGQGLVVVQRHAVVDWPDATIHWWEE